MNPQGRRFVPAAGLLLGLAGMTCAVVLRYAPSLLAAADGQVRFGTVGAVPTGVAWLVALALEAWLLIAGARETIRRMGSQSRVVVVALLFLLTLLPVQYSRGKVSDQGVIASLMFGTVGITGLVIGLGAALNRPARLLLALYDRLQNLSPRNFLLLSGGLVFLLTNLVSWLVFAHIPRIHDNVAQLFQAQLFAQGRLFAPSPVLPQFFDLMLMVNDGRWYSQYPPGHPLMLALGVLLRVPWIINPVLGTLTVVVIYRLGQELYDERTARLGTLLAAGSPLLILMSSQFMNHASSLFFAVLFMLEYARAFRAESSSVIRRASSRGNSETISVHQRSSAVDSPRSGFRTPHALLAGLALGMVLLVRPYTALLVALPFAVDAVIRLYQTRGHLRGRAALMLVGGAVMAGLLMLYNQATGGNPLELGYVTRYGPGHGLGFGGGGWGEQTYTPVKALAATGLDLNAVNRYLFELPIPSLLFIALLFAGARVRRPDWLLLGVFAGLVGGHFFYWWHDLLFGPRWEYEAIPALVLLTARGIRERPRIAAAESRLGTGRLFVLCGLSLLAVAVPNLIRRIPDTFGIRTETARAVRPVETPAVVVTPRLGDVFLDNRVPPGGDVIYANDLGALNPLLARQYPGRRFYYANLDTLRELTDIGYENSELKVGLDSIVAELERRDRELYSLQSIFWPTDELTDMVQPVALRHGLKVVSYRTLDRMSVQAGNKLPVKLPALAAWVLGDLSEHVLVFGYMNRNADYTAGGLQFKRIGASPNGRVVLYAVYPATR